MHVFVISHPTVFDMLETTLRARCHQRPVLRSPYTGTLAIVPLRTDASCEELELACAMHAALERGLFVLA